jgi:N-acetylglucosamine kinase-like BadF-type ATPase
MLKLIADCGSTKVEWVVINSDTKSIVKQFITTGFNAAVTPQAEISRLLSSELAPEIADFQIAQLHFYGAGCIGGEVDRRLSEMLRSVLVDADIEIAGDLLAAARGLFGNQVGIACILGTGSNSGEYNGKDIVANTPPMGYILGDEGSGAVLGKLLINRIFKYPGLLSKDIIDDFFATYGLTKADVIERVYRQPAANRFLASFAPFIKKHVNNPLIREMVAQAFRDFVNANLTGYHRFPRLGFVGSVAYHFSDILTDVCIEEGLPEPTILRAPLLSLVKYHM